MPDRDAELILRALLSGWTLELGGGQISLVEPPGWAPLDQAGHRFEPTKHTVPLDKHRWPVLDEWVRGRLKEERDK